MNTRTIPDAEQLIGTYLRGHESVDARVGGRMPSASRGPWIRLTQLDAADVGGQEHLIDYLLQLDCYAGSDAADAHAGHAEAARVAFAARAALKDLRGTVLDGVAIGEVAFQAMSRIPDIAFEPERERYVLDVSVFMHR